MFGRRPASRGVRGDGVVVRCRGVPRFGGVVCFGDVPRVGGVVRGRGVPRAGRVLRFGDAPRDGGAARLGCVRRGGGVVRRGGGVRLAGGLVLGRDGGAGGALAGFPPAVFGRPPRLPALRGGGGRFGLAFLSSSHVADGGVRVCCSDSAGPDSYVDWWYFSIVTATTTGFGDYAPIGVSRLLACMEIGLFLVLLAGTIQVLTGDRELT